MSIERLLTSGKKRVTGIAAFVGILVTVFFWLCLISGCAVGPKYERPKLQMPEGFRGGGQTETNSFADLPWWQVFHDDALQSLVQVALTNNLDLRIAVSRVEQARQLAVEARADLFPQIGYSGIAARGKNVGVNNTPSPTGTTGSIFGGDVNATWEIDLWGRVRRLTESARAQYFASQEARRDVTTSLIAQVASDYFQLLALDRELAIARDTTNSFGQSLKIFTERLQGGVASKLETSSAEALMDSAAATIPELEQQIAIEENQISVLLGTNPGPILRGSPTLDGQVPPEVPSGLPSALLERRPDIREAEQQLRSANALVGVAQADFLPQLSLTGLLGRVSPEVSVFTGGGATAWSAAASLTGPIFQGGRLKAEYQRAKAAREESALQYQSAVLNALHEVADSLISRVKLAEARILQERAVAAYQEAVATAMKRYQLGNASYYEVLQEQQLLFPAENSLVQTQVSQLLDIVQLYRALGGGWQNQETNSTK
jgi:multidrug efflux system outer membrane protein